MGRLLFSPYTSEEVKAADHASSNPFLGATSVWPVVLSETKKTPSQERDADIPIQTTEQAN
jgi:hypothetical protein